MGASTAKPDPRSPLSRADTRVVHRLRLIKPPMRENTCEARTDHPQKGAWTDGGLQAAGGYLSCSFAAGRREIMIVNTSIHLRKRRFLTRMEEIPLFHQRGCIKTVTWRFSHIYWRWVKEVRKIDEHTTSMKQFDKRAIINYRCVLYFVFVL